MKLGLYKVVAAVQFKIYPPEAFYVSSRYMESRFIKTGDVFRVVRSENKGDGVDRMLIVMGDGVYCLKVGEMIPRVAFEFHSAPGAQIGL